MCSGQEVLMRERLVHWGPLVVIVDATSWQDYLGGVIQHHCSSHHANHAVLIIGYDTTGTTQMHTNAHTNFLKGTYSLFSFFLSLFSVKNRFFCNRKYSSIIEEPIGEESSCFCYFKTLLQCCHNLPLHRILPLYPFIP